MATAKKKAGKATLTPETAQLGRLLDKGDEPAEGVRRYDCPKCGAGHIVTPLYDGPAPAVLHFQFECRAKGCGYIAAVGLG